MLFGSIDQIDGDRISGWLASSEGRARPIVLVNGLPAAILRDDESRLPKVHLAGIVSTSEFECVAPPSDGEASVELWGVSDCCREQVDRKNMRGTAVRDPFFSLLRAEKIARLPNAIAVVCWDGAHNPIGRAKVLYDVAETQYPVVLFTYLFEEFGKEIWQPLRSVDFNFVGIPWNQRDRYHRLLRQLDIQFDTVWICKPRLPSFQLASVVARDSARVVLDIDDNEQAFSISKGSRGAPYGLGSIGLSRLLTDAVTARTVASVSLKDHFGGELLRHAREELKP